jgi:glycopeptide antibiotics resistance protein
MSPLPGFIPGVGASLVVSGLASGRVARALGSSRFLSFALIASIGVVASATLTPFTGGPAPHPGSCDMSRISVAPLHDLLRVGDVSGNVMLFVPLGVCIALLPASRLRLMLVVAAAAYPVAIESTQLLVPALNRTCESADVFDNLTGLAVGLAAAAMARLAARRVLAQAGRAHATRGSATGSRPARDSRTPRD